MVRSEDDRPGRPAPNYAYNAAMKPSKELPPFVRIQTRWAAALWTALGVWFLVHVARHYWDGLVEGSLSAWAALAFCSVLILSSCASWRQKRWAMPLMCATLVVVILFSLDWLLFFALKATSVLALPALLLLLGFSLYTITLLVIAFRSRAETS